MAMPPKTHEFARLLAAAGWSQAEAARRLQITPGAVSQFCNGKTQPRPTTLNLLKLILARENPKVLALHESQGWRSLAHWEKDLLTELRQLAETDRQRLLPIFKQMIKAMPGHPRTQRG
jgi:transcriptional regulator with XRE-family HTH domain